MLIEPLARRLNKLGLKKSVASAISVLVFTLIIVGTFVGAAYIMTSQITALAAKLPYYQQLFTEQFQKNMATVESRINGLRGEL